jgi:hypothetical protein
VFTAGFRAGRDRAVLMVFAVAVTGPVIITTVRHSISPAFTRAQPPGLLPFQDDERDPGPLQ